MTYLDTNICTDRERFLRRIHYRSSGRAWTCRRRSFPCFNWDGRIRSILSPSLPLYYFRSCKSRIYSWAERGWARVDIRRLGSSRNPDMDLFGQERKFIYSRFYRETQTTQDYHSCTIIIPESWKLRDEPKRQRRVRAFKTFWRALWIELPRGEIVVEGIFGIELRG